MQRKDSYCVHTGR